MANNQNLCLFTGNLGSDPELRYTPNQTAVCNISIAVSGSKKVSGNWEDVTEWVRLVFLGRKAEVLNEYCKKGSKIRVETKYQQRIWEKDGQKHYAHEFLVNAMELLDSRSDHSAGHNSGSVQQSSNDRTQSASAPEGGFDDDGIPFANPYKRREYLI